VTKLDGLLLLSALGDRIHKIAEEIVNSGDDRKKILVPIVVNGKVKNMSLRQLANHAAKVAKEVRL
jgi:hypothetical protein